jgi:DNA-binding GntR family transcriptional regulator
MLAGFIVLEGLEVVATRVLAERGSREAVSALEPIVAAMDRAAADGRFEEWADLNTRFHQAISVATELPLLQEMTERLLGRWDRIRRHYFNGVLSHRVKAAQREHRNILSALADQDLPRLQNEVQHHNRCALEAYLRYLDNLE